MRFPRFSDKWHQAEIGALVEINPRNKNDIPDSFLYIDLESVKRGELVKHVISDKKGAPSRAQRLLEEGDILYSCVRPYQHNNYLFTDSQIAVASTGFACLRGAECPEFLYQLLNADRFTNAVLERCTGTSYPAINSTDLSSIKVMVPSKNEQLTIGTLIGLIDSKITVQNKIIEEKKREMMALNDELYSHAIKTIHGFADIADNYSGLLGKNSEDFGKGASYITYLNVLNNRYIDKSSCGYVTIHKNEKQNTVLHGDVVLTLSSETPKEVGVSSVYLGNDTLYLNSFCFGIRFKTEETVLPEYATWLFSTTAFRKHIYPFAQGSTRYNLNLGSFMKSSFAFPSVDDQRRFAGLLNRLEESIKLEIKMLDELELAKSFLLQQLFI